MFSYIDYLLSNQLMDFRYNPKLRFHFHIVTEWLRLGTSADNLVQPPYLQQGQQPQGAQGTQNPVEF